MNAMLLDLKRKGSLSEQLYSRLRSSAGCTPLLYGLPKIHKPDIPLRPIASFIQSPSYQLSKHLAHILSPLVGNTDSHVTNSSEFASFIQEQAVRISRNGTERNGTERSGPETPPYLPERTKGQSTQPDSTKA